MSGSSEKKERLAHGVVLADESHATYVATVSKPFCVRTVHPHRFTGRIVQKGFGNVNDRTGFSVYDYRDSYRRRA
jgi:hypothetical protein